MLVASLLDGCLNQGLTRKVLGFGVLGLKYHVLGMKMVVSDQSNWS